MSRALDARQRIGVVRADARVVLGVDARHRRAAREEGLGEAVAVQRVFAAQAVFGAGVGHQLERGALLTPDVRREHLRDDVGGGFGDLRGVGPEHLERGGAAGGEEPLAAAVAVPPAFEMDALGVLAGEHVGFELLW